MLERGTSNTTLFGAPIVMPTAEDLLAHLLLHATLHWIRYGRLHRPEDFPAVTAALAIDPARCARHLREQGLAPHALVLLPKVLGTAEAPFLSSLVGHLHADRRERAAAWAIAAICARFAPGHPARRLAGLALAPSLGSAAKNAVADRFRGYARGVSR
jgi:hypothetical protein